MNHIAAVFIFFFLW